jgi:hypothetical protein
MPAARRPPPPVQVDFGRIAAATAFHATAASPTSKSGAFTSELLALKETGKISHKHSFLSRINSQESDYRYLEMQVDQTISVPIAQLRADAQVLEASIELQAQARRLLKRTVYCELFPWCEAAPMHPADRMRLPALLPSTGNCSHGSKKTSFAPQKKFPAGPGEATENHTHLSRLPPAAVGGNHLPESLSGPCR